MMEWGQANAAANYGSNVNNNNNNNNAFASWFPQSNDQNNGFGLSSSSFGTPTALPSPWNNSMPTAPAPAETRDDYDDDDDDMTISSSASTLFGWTRNHKNSNNNNDRPPTKPKKNRHSATAASPKKKGSSSSSSSTPSQKWDDAQTKALAGLLRPADVLLGPKCSVSNLLAKGTSGYHKVLDTYRSAFKEQRHFHHEEIRLIQTIIDAVWAQEGRFMTFDESTGVLAMVPNEDVIKQVRKDLIKAPALSLLLGKKKKAKSTEARKKKLRQQKATAGTTLKKSKPSWPKKHYKSTNNNNNKVKHSVSTSKHNKKKKHASRKSAASA